MRNDSQGTEITHPELLHSPLVRGGCWGHKAATFVRILAHSRTRTSAFGLPSPGSRLPTSTALPPIRVGSWRTIATQPCCQPGFHTCQGVRSRTASTEGNRFGGRTESRNANANHCSSWKHQTRIVETNDVGPNASVPDGRQQPTDRRPSLLSASVWKKQ